MSEDSQQHSTFEQEFLIELEHVSKRFRRYHSQRSIQQWFIDKLRGKHETNDEDDFWSLKDVSLTVSRGERIGIVGHNGSGKSTLLKLMTGILEPTEGEVRVNGRVSALLELGAGFHPDLTGRENIILNATLHGLKRKTIEERLSTIVDFAGLKEFIDTPVKHYSSGMYMRLGFSVAIHTDPDLLIVDEVLAVGDAEFQKKCMTTIHDFSRAGGTLVLVTHDLGAVEMLCNRAVWMDKGVVRQSGTPKDVVLEYLSATSRAITEKAEQEKTEKRESEDGSTTDGDESAENTHRIGNRKVEFTDIRLCDQTGTPTMLFQHGESMEIQMHYRVLDKVEVPVIGIGIHHQNGSHVTGPNTAFDEIELPDQHEGILSYCIPSLPLLPGHYYVSVAAIHGVTQEIYDMHDRMYEFHIDEGSARERYGLVSLNGDWHVHQS
ncbi:MAG: ABC transporter ATP-binding protein [Chloroflexota bacterium]